MNIIITVQRMDDSGHVLKEVSGNIERANEKATFEMVQLAKGWIGEAVCRVVTPPDAEE